MKRVVIIEDETMLRDLLAELLKNFPLCTLAGAYGDGLEGLKALQKIKPDMVILDIKLPSLNGLEILRRLREQLPNCNVLLFSAFFSTSMVRQALQAGANGIIEKTAGLPETILHVRRGRRAARTGRACSRRLNWDLRLKRMRAHTALHLLTAVLPYPVTGGSVGDGEGRLDFDSGDAALDKAEITERLNALIATNAAVGTRWITDEELAANPGLVKTMSVKPPTGSGRVRLVEIEGIDLQPCGGTHVARTGEIGRAEVTQIEKKGKINRRVRIALTEPQS